jgi:hypothetical protein
MRKETYEFQRDIVIGGENTRTGKIMAERVIRYFEEKQKQKVKHKQKHKKQISSIFVMHLVQNG